LSTDNTIWHLGRASADAAWNSTWDQLGGQLATAAATVTSWGVGRADLFARSQDALLTHLWHVRDPDSGGIADWGLEDRNEVLPHSALAACSWGPGRIDVVGLDYDDSLNHTFYQDDVGWGWEPLGWGDAALPASDSQTRPEFEALWRLLSQRQEIAVPAGTRGDDRSGTVRAFQRFVDPSGLATHSAELHTDKTIYLAWTPTRVPAWYDPDPVADIDGMTAPAGFDGTLMTRDGFKFGNVDTATWDLPLWSFPAGHSPAPRWFTVARPASVAAKDWAAFLADNPPPLASVPGPARALHRAGAFCFWDTIGVSNALTGPPEWQTILPVNRYRDGDRILTRLNGQKVVTKPDGTTRPATWTDLYHLAQTAPDTLDQVVAFYGHPTRGDIKDRRIPWVRSAISGTVTNSHLAGVDATPAHVTRDELGAPDYWLGLRDPAFAIPGCGYSGLIAHFTATLQLCNDWNVLVRPDPDYRFALFGSDEPGWTIGNFEPGLSGSVECEMEQWLVPVGFRPEPGDRITIGGRWIIDCGHDNYGAELHPFDSYTSAHAEAGRWEAVGNIETSTAVVVSGAWLGGRLSFDLWPPCRPAAAAVMHYDQTVHRADELTWSLTALPCANPNHLRIQIDSDAPHESIRTGDFGEVYYNPRRRFAGRFHLWWQMD
jgi:hypothetical protein